MRLLHKRIILITVGWLCLAAASPAESITLPERPERYVVDLAGIIDAETEAKLNGYLQELEQKWVGNRVGKICYNLKRQACMPGKKGKIQFKNISV